MSDNASNKLATIGVVESVLDGTCKFSTRSFDCGESRVGNHFTIQSLNVSRVLFGVLYLSGIRTVAVLQS